MHVSQLADRFVKDPHEVVKAGDVVRVRVTEVDVPRKRIGLTMRKDNNTGRMKGGAAKPDAKHGGARGNYKNKADASRAQSQKAAPAGGALGSALAAALQEKRGKS